MPEILVCPISPPLSPITVLFLRHKARHESEATGNLKVYPNPATESMYVPLESDAQVRLSDMFGRTLRTWQGKAPGLTIRRDDLPEGIYLLEARLAKGKMQTGKVVWQSKQ